MDMHNELATWGHGRIEKKRKELAMLLRYFDAETRALKGTMTAVPKPGDGTVTFKMEKGYPGVGKTGPLSCESSITVEVTLVKGYDKFDDWGNTYVALVASDIPLAKIRDVLS